MGKCVVCGKYVNAIYGKKCITCDGIFHLNCGNSSEHPYKKTIDIQFGTVVPKLIYTCRNCLNKNFAEYRAIENARIKKEREEEEARLEREKEKEYTENLNRAKNYEKSLRYEDSAKLYEELGMWDEAGRVRKLAHEKKAPQTKVDIGHVDQSVRSHIQDSVVMKSNIGGEPKVFKRCPYCGESLNFPKPPKFCPYCEEQLQN